MSTPNQISVSAATFGGFSQRQLLAAMVFLLQQVAGNTMSANQLAIASNCICGDDRQLMMMAVYLLSQIASSGTGGGSGLSGVGSPQGVITANPGATYLQTDTNSFWAKNNGTGNTGWIELIV